MQKKGIIFDIKKYAVHDGSGIRTTVFFKGCPLNCWWCHNPESQRLQPEEYRKINRRRCLNLSYSETRDVFGREVSVDEVIHEIEKDLPFYDQSKGGVTFSGGDPLMQPDFLNSLLVECKLRNICTAVDTSGYVAWKIFDRIIDKVDLFLYDLKLMNDELHQKYTGVSNGLIHENLSKLTKGSVPIIIRIPLIPDITDTDENLIQIGEFVSGLENIQQIDLLPYNPIGEDKYLRLNKVNKLGYLEVQTDQKIDHIRIKLASFDLKVEIGG
jgi:pyruvate formate lyase activating enzyme